MPQEESAKDTQGNEGLGNVLTADAIETAKPSKADAKAKASKTNQVEEGQPFNDNHRGGLEDWQNEAGEKSKSNKKDGGKDFEFSLTKKYNVRFTKDHGYMKKGMEQEVSEQAFQIYDKAGVIEKV